MSAITREGDPPLLAVEDVGRLLSVSTRTVWRLRSEGKLPKPVKLRGTVRWNAAEIRRWIDAGCPAQEKRPSSRK
jgi:predicted DNA-binding transcriptional regulator AlpA